MISKVVGTRVWTVVLTTIDEDSAFTKVSTQVVIAEDRTAAMEIADCLLSQMPLHGCLEVEEAVLIDA